MVFRGFVSNRNEENKSKNDKLVYLGLSILKISKTLMYEFWYDYIKPKYQNNAKLCYMDTVLLFILELSMLMKTLQMLLKKGLIQQTVKSIDHCLQERIKK